MPNFEIYSFAKKILWKSSQLVHMVVRGLLRLFESLANWSLSIRHLKKGPAEVQLNSWWITVSLSDQSLIIQANFTLGNEIFYNT